MKQRLVYIDCLRGVAILMVVYSHVLSFSMDHMEPSPLGQWMRDVMLPLFFFISGFCAYKPIQAYTTREMLLDLKDKSLRILVPTVVMYLVFMVISGNDALFYAFRYDKSGYWFTWVLFQIFVLYLIFRRLSCLSENKWVRIAILFAPFVIMTIVFKYVGFESQAARLFEWVKVKGYYLFFLAGVMVRRFAPQVNALLQNRYINFGLLTAAVLTYFGLDDAVGIGGGILLIFCVLTLYYLFMTSEGILSKPDNLFARQLAKIGRNTLPIYFLHFYLLFRIPILPDFLMSLKSDVCFGMNSSVSMVEFCCVGFIAVVVSYACIGIKYVIERFPIVSQFCLGITKRR